MDNDKRLIESPLHIRLVLKRVAENLLNPFIRPLKKHKDRDSLIDVIWIEYGNRKRNHIFVPAFKDEIQSLFWGLEELEEVEGTLYPGPYSF